MCWTEVSSQAEENRWFQALARKTGRIKFIKKYPKTLKRHDTIISLSSHSSMETCIFFLVLQEQFEPVCKAGSAQHFQTCLLREFHFAVPWHNMQEHKWTFPLLTAELQLYGQISSKKNKNSNYLGSRYKMAAPPTCGTEKTFRPVPRAPLQTGAEHNMVWTLSGSQQCHQSSNNEPFNELQLSPQHDRE